MANKKSTKKTTTKKKVVSKKKIEEKELEVEEPEEEKEVKEVKREEFKMPHKKSKFKGLIIAVVFVAAFVLLSLVLPTNGEKQENIKYSVSDWAEDVKEQTVVTVLASTTCPHCQEYKPVITALAKKHDFKLYFFEMEELSSDEQNVVMTTFDLENYDGGVPFTFIVKNGKVVSDTTGFSTEDDTIKYLKTNELIKD